MADKNKSEFCDLEFNLNKINNSTIEDSPDADGVSSKELEKQIKLEKLNKLKDDRDLRKEYANKVFIFISSWSIGLFLILLLNRFRSVRCITFPLFPIFFIATNFDISFSLSDSVLITLLTTSFIEVLGLFYFVMRYLFAIDGDKKAIKNHFPYMVNH